MGKTKSGTTGLKVGLILIAILIIALAIMTYVLFCVELGNPYGDIVIKYDKLKTVMADDVFYLSQDFLILNLYIPMAIMIAILIRIFIFTER